MRDDERLRVRMMSRVREIERGRVRVREREILREVDDEFLGFAMYFSHVPVLFFYLFFKNKHLSHLKLNTFSLPLHLLLISVC